KWNTLRIKTLSYAHHRCAAGGAAKPLDCHEHWTFSNRVARVTKLVALCRRCHDTVHLSPDLPTAVFNRLARHWCRVNGRARRTFDRYYSRKRAEYLKREGEPFKIDYGRFAYLCQRTS